MFIDKMRFLYTENQLTKKEKIKNKKIIIRDKKLVYNIHNNNNAEKK